MVTTTTPRADSASPSYIATEPAPVMNAPPWMNTMTGRPFPPGVQTLRTRQSSLSTPADMSASTRVEAATACGAAGPKRVASRTPDHETGGCGGANRSGPTGGAAYGMPRYAVTALSTSRPHNRPVETTSSVTIEPSRHHRVR